MTARAATRTWLAVSAVVGALAGCGGPKQAAIETVPAYMPSAEALWRLKRVVLVELDPRDASPQVARELSESVFLAVQNRRVFPVDLMASASAIPIAVSMPAGQGPRFTLEQLGEMRSALKCDAVLVGAVTGFEPYPGAWIAVQLWLVDLRTGHVMWGVDHAWRTTDEATSKRMRRYFNPVGGEDGADPIRLAEMSPRMFTSFVAFELANALPQPPGPASPEPRQSPVAKALAETKKIFTN
jgi:hypothetical protein